MKNILIVRSVSFQQLDLNMPAIIKKYEPCKISILTHEHGVELAKKYSDIDKIYVYPYKSGFDVNKKVKDLENVEFDTVIVPVTNINGGGFYNVLKFTKSIKCNNRSICNVISEIKNFSIKDIYMLQFKNCIMNIASFLATAVLSPIILLSLVYRLCTIKKSN